MQRLERVAGQLAPAVAAGAAAAHKPVNVVVTGAAGNIAYSAVFMIGSGLLLGPDRPVNLRLLDLPAMEGKLQGVKMELDDCAYPLLASITATSSYEVAFKDADICLLIGAKPRGPGMERKDLLTQNASIFAGQGKAIDQFASRNVKVLVVGNPTNTNAMIAMVNAPSIPPANFTALTRLDQNRAVSQVAAKAGVLASQVRNVIIWGNHSSTQYPDITHATVAGEPAAARLKDDAWVRGAFIAAVQQRGAAIIKARTLSSAASAANAAMDHIRAWVLGTAPGEIVSMAVPSDGSYGIPKGIVFSFPCTCKAGTYSIVQGLEVSAFSREKLAITTKELLEEKADALGSK